MRSHRVLRIALLFSIQFTISCSGRLPESVGPSQEILVLADPADWKLLEEPLREVFEKTILTPQEEKVFQIQLGSIEDLEEQKHLRRKNLLIIAPVDASHPTAEFMRDLLDPRSRNTFARADPRYTGKRMYGREISFSSRFPARISSQWEIRSVRKATVCTNL